MRVHPGVEQLACPAVTGGSSELLTKWRVKRRRYKRDGKGRRSSAAGRQGFPGADGILIDEVAPTNIQRSSLNLKCECTEYMKIYFTVITKQNPLNQWFLFLALEHTFLCFNNVNPQVNIFSRCKLTQSEKLNFQLSEVLTHPCPLPRIACQLAD